MPRAINNISKVYIDDLLIKIRKESGLSLHDDQDFYKLVKMIRDIDKCSPGIDISTLKRLFRNNIKTPTEATLDIAAKYAGYNDWNYFVKDTREKDEYYLQHILSIIQNEASKEIDIELIKKVCNKYGSRKEHILFLSNLVRIASEKKDINFFKELFKLPKVFEDNENRFYDYYYLGQSVCIAMRNNTELAEAVKRIYCHDKNAIERCIKNFVDEDYLDGYYGAWIDEYMKNKPDDQYKIFCYCMKYTQGYQKGDNKETKKWYKKLINIDFDDANKPMLLGRYFAIKQIEDNNTTDVLEVIKKVVNKVSRRKDNEGFYLGFQLYMLRYLYMAKLNKWMVEIVKLFDLHFKDTMNAIPSEHWNRKTFHALQIYRAYTYKQENDSVKANTVFKQIDTNYFDPFIYNSLLNDYTNVKNLIGL